ncbi:MAG: right-handed parallel beta-helix repeat-containing protein [Nitrosomonadaceae bacterium]
MAVWTQMLIKAQWFDLNGDPLSGGVLKAYEPGTTTGISIAITKTGGSPQSSITLNAEGKLEVSGNEVLPFIDREHKWAIFANSADATANTPAFAGFYDNVPQQVGAEPARDIDNFVTLRAATSADYTAGDVIHITDSLRYGDFVITVGTVTDDDGTRIVFTDDSNKYAKRRREVGFWNVRWFGAGTGVVDSATAITNAITELTDFEEIHFPPGQYVVKSSIDFRGIQNFTISGVKRSSWIMFDHSTGSGFDMNNPSFTGPAPSFRNIKISYMTFYAATTVSSLPVTSVFMRNCPESRIEGCTFIGCATSIQLFMDECWSSYIGSQNFFSVGENLTTGYGAPFNASAAGIAITLDKESHACEISNNRIRKGSPSMSVKGNDGIVIRNNSIESSVTNGIEFTADGAGVQVSVNYFEGNIGYDIVYQSAATNFANTINNNFHNADKAIKIESGCDCNQLRIINNEFTALANGIEIEDSVVYKNVVIKDNTMKNVTNPYLFASSDMATTGLVYPNNRLLIDNGSSGTTGDPKILHNKTILNEVATWATFSGTGSASDGSINHSGVLMYDLAGTTGWNAFVDLLFDVSVKNEFITICIPFVSPAGTNVTVTIDDGVATKAYTCNSSTAPAAAAENMFYYQMSSTADKIRIRVNVGAITIQALIPSVRIGCHNELAYKDFR